MKYKQLIKDNEILYTKLIKDKYTLPWNPKLKDIDNNNSKYNDTLIRITQIYNNIKLNRTKYRSNERIYLNRSNSIL